MSANDRELEAAFAQAFPFGEYDKERTACAARLCGDAIRYLNHATNWDATRALPDPVATYEALVAISDALERMPQLLRQVASRCREHAIDSKLAASDWGDDPTDFAAGLAKGSADELDKASSAISPAVSRVKSATSGMAYLYLSDGDMDSDAEADAAGW